MEGVLFLSWTVTSRTVFLSSLQIECNILVSLNQPSLLNQVSKVIAGNFRLRRAMKQTKSDQHSTKTTFNKMAETFS